MKHGHSLCFYLHMSNGWDNEHFYFHSFVSRWRSLSKQGLGLWAACLLVLLSGMCREVHQPKSLHELIDIDAPVLVEVNALGQVCNGLVTDLCLKMRAQEFPGLTKLLERDWTYKECKGGGFSFTLYRFILSVSYRCYPPIRLLSDLSDLCQ